MTSLAWHGLPWSCSTSTCPAAAAWRSSANSRPNPACTPSPWWCSPPHRAQADISRSYELHANAYIIKPFDAAQFTDAIGHIDDFFLTLVKRPQ
jgi:hypothetical protein